MIEGATLNLLCAGAVKGLVLALQERFERATGARIEARFDAVGALREALVAGAPCDVLVVTAAMAHEIEGDAWLLAGSTAPLGRVPTGVAVRAGTAPVPIDDAPALRERLLAADAIYFPDAARSTAGRHFDTVLARLGIRDAVASRLQMFANGATAMRELAASGTAAAIGCTQVTEIAYTPGLTLVGALPAPFELTTVYAAAVSASAVDAPLAHRLVALLAGDESRSLRIAGGFDLSGS